ncbi:MAG: hypothetical protein JSR97_03000 [Verrucomicrobia bacterium]|nr:hypothetical protein [Verrucomicrobiota bacterium]
MKHQPSWHKISLAPSFIFVLALFASISTSASLSSSFTCSTSLCPSLDILSQQVKIVGNSQWAQASLPHISSHPVSSLSDKKAPGFKESYIQFVSRLHQTLKQHKWEFTAHVLATILTEPVVMCQAGYLLYAQPQSYSNLNPSILTAEQSAYSPILLIHGDHSNSGLFIPLIRYLTQKNPHRPIFTVDLSSPDGCVSAQYHLDILAQKLQDIASLYTHTPKISLIGHSSGGDIIAPLAKKMPAYVGPMIKIGSILKVAEVQDFENSFPKSILEIVGTKDAIEGTFSHLSRTLCVPCGHVGLLFNTTVFQYIYHSCAID